MTTKETIGLLLMLSPFLWIFYSAWRSGVLKAALQGAAMALAISAVMVIGAYLLTGGVK